MWRRLFLLGVLLLPSPVTNAALIHDAAKKGDAAAVAAALDKGADVNDSDGSATALYYAVTKRHLETTHACQRRCSKRSAAVCPGMQPMP